MKIASVHTQVRIGHKVYPQQSFENYRGDLNALVVGQHAFYKAEGEPTALTIHIVFSEEGSSNADSQ